MDPDVSVANATCEMHADRPAIDRCSSCGRTVCLRCAVPVRGRVLCTSCAARAVGEPAPVVPARRRTRVPDTVAAALLGVALVGTIPPWDRFGTAFSAWRPTVSSARVLGAVALAVAFVAAAVAAWRGPSRRSTAATAGYTLLAAAGAVALAWQLVASPDFVAHTLTPYAVIGLATGSAVVGAIRLRRRA